MAGSGAVTLEVDGRELQISNPEKVFFPEVGVTKMDLVQYYMRVADGVLAGARERPTTLHRFPSGVLDEGFYQKRLPAKRPEWIRSSTVTFPSGRFAEMLVVADAAHLVWAANLGCLEINPWPVRAADVDHPDELRIDLDPTPGISFDDVRRTALVAREVLEEHGLRGFVKTSGKRGIHVNARVEPRWEFTMVRRAALAFAREVERRLPGVATTAWWKEERRGVFVDYNQNARDRTVASAYSVRPTPDARVSCPIEWDEVATVEPADLTLRTVPERFARDGDPGKEIDAEAGSLDALLDLALRDEREGLGEAPWPPNYPKAPGEPPRVQPSRAKGARAKASRATPEGVVAPPAPGKRAGPTGRRRSTMPLIEVARAATQAEAHEALDRWRAKHPGAAKHLEVGDVLVDSMRGRSTTWTRIRVNLRNVPEPDRPPQEELEVDYDPWEGVRWPDGERPRPARKRTK
ncbi:MAG TPA: non-homologous end-joining DNA ligase [Actinomycetota bacterium]|nr:non-homologous end-joining DNA ligase [Actinomycetota bacterium]